MLAHLSTFALDGLDPRRVWIEVDIRLGLPAFTIVGLADRAVREARERVRSAIQNSGFVFPQKRITVNLAPAYLHKTGPGFDLGLAMGVLAASEQVPVDSAARLGYCGELSLAGELRPVRGALAVAEGARAAGLDALIVPRLNGPEAALAGDLPVFIADSLREVVDLVCDRCEPQVAGPADVVDVPATPALDLADVRGHAWAISALTVAAAGGHNVLMTGPPGTGKTMLARRLPGILTPLEADEALDVVRIHSVAGLGFFDRLPHERPFRAPHHSISASGLVGGGNSPRPGEVSLAHQGVLFLDELSQFSPPTLEALRQPLEDGAIAIVRGQQTRIFPTRCMLVAASNPCPCGYLGDGQGRCHCDRAAIERHERRLSGPLADRIDLHVTVARPDASALGGPPGVSSAGVRDRVLQARERQRRRYAGVPGVRTNAELPAGLADRLAQARPAVSRELLRLYGQGRFTARGHLRILRLARTVADLEGSDQIETSHLDLALGMRAQSPADRVAA